MPAGGLDLGRAEKCHTGFVGSTHDRFAVTDTAVSGITFSIAV
jgi:hypothetical protein